jgi:hypothetical protein
VEDLTRYTWSTPRTVAVLFVDTIAFHHDLLGADDLNRCFSIPPEGTYTTPPGPSPRHRSPGPRCTATAVSGPPYTDCLCKLPDY